MSKKQENAAKRKAEKQQAALAQLHAARIEGPIAVATLAWDGNVFIKNVFDGLHLAPGVTKFEATEAEMSAVVDLDKARRRTARQALLAERERATFIEAVDAFATGDVFTAARKMLEVNRLKWEAQR